MFAVAAATADKVVELVVVVVKVVVVSLVVLNGESLFRYGTYDKEPS